MSGSPPLPLFRNIIVLDPLAGRGTIMLACGALLLSAGCGASTYERRLNETKGYFAYLNKLDEELSRSRWEEAGVSIRVPKIFDSVSLPSSSTDGRRSAEESPYPALLGSPVPGLVGAWVADVETDDGAAPCRLYVLSNYNLWLSDETVELAQDYRTVAARRIANALGEPVPDMGDWSGVRIPTGAGYVEQRTFDVTTFHPAEPLDDVLYDIDVYFVSDGDIRAAFVLMEPRKSNPNARIEEKFELSLETLALDSRAPERGDGKSRGGRRRRRTGPGF